ncbi:uncharacterized protein LOC127481899 [Manacus candei]|uniref:uncharacterized protein LOC127481899 n=1 Tax=Manacus candei TaxID=415023 RepID=UPI00222767A1|nr:uncharacterized protein LOC127481899 [Manacus candei]
MMLGVVALLWHMTMPRYLSHLSTCFSSHTSTYIAISTFEFVHWVYDTANSAPVIFIRNISSRIHYCSSLSCFLWGFKDNSTHSYGDTQGNARAQPFIQFPFGYDTMASGKFKSFLDVRDISIVGLFILNCATIAYLIYQAKAKNYREGVQEPDPGVENLEWRGLWEDMGKFLESCSAPMTWKLTLEQLLNPIKIMKAVRERGRDGSMEKQVTAACGVLAIAYRKLLGMVQHSQGKGKDEDKMPNIKVTQDKEKTKGQTKPTEVATIHRKKCKAKSVRLVDDDGEAGSSQAAAPETEIITESLSYNNLRNLRADVARRPSEPVLAWMIRVWDSTGDAVNLDGGEARFLRSIAQDVGIEEVFVRESKPLSLWARLVDGVRERFIYRDSLQADHYTKSWKTIEEGILRLREMALLEVLFGGDGQPTNDPDKVKCTPQMWWSFTRMGPSIHKGYLTSLEAGEKREPVMSVINKLRLYDSMIGGPIQARISSVETIVNELKELTTGLKEKIERNNLHTAPVRTRRPSARENRQTSRTELWYFLSDHGEDMRRWDRKPTRALAARVQELKGKEKGKSAKVSAVPVSCGQGSDSVTGHLKIQGPQYQMFDEWSE